MKSLSSKNAMYHRAAPSDGDGVNPLVEREYPFKTQNNLSSISYWLNYMIYKYFAA